MLCLTQLLPEESGYFQADRDRTTTWERTEVPATQDCLLSVVKRRERKVKWSKEGM